LLTDSTSDSKVISTSPMFALQEGGGGVAAAARQHRHVLVQLADEVRAWASVPPFFFT
jgi:hypothetical protein